MVRGGKVGLEVIPGLVDNCAEMPFAAGVIVNPSLQDEEISSRDDLGVIVRAL